MTSDPTIQFWLLTALILFSSMCFAIAVSFALLFALLVTSLVAKLRKHGLKWFTEMADDDDDDESEAWKKG